MNEILDLFSLKMPPYILNKHNIFSIILISLTFLPASSNRKASKPLQPLAMRAQLCMHHKVRQTLMRL